MRTACHFLLVVLLFSSIPAAAQPDSNKDKKKDEKAEVKKGDPPPGAAKGLSPGIARIMLRDLLQKRYLVSVSDMFLVPGESYFESKSIRVTRDDLSFEFDFTRQEKRTTGRATIRFKDLDYVKTDGAKINRARDEFYIVSSRRVWSGVTGGAYSMYVLGWKDERDAQRVVDALNRLIYEARAVVTPKDDLSPFAANVQQWRDKPESRPVAPDGWDRHRILAEQGIKDKDFVAAILNYERGVTAYPLWAQGWFNAALLYAELGEYDSAANRMKHYLLLAPDAPDAKAAREKVIIWEDKARQ